MKNILDKLLKKEDLTVKESENLAKEILQGKLTQVQITGVLTALRMKGESVDEITGFVKAIRDTMLKIESFDAIDVCGTGGDGKNTFNISTAVALVVVSGGVSVAKHGNSAVSSKSGSADVLRELGVFIDLKPSQAEEVLKKIGIVFLLAPLFHPAFKHVSLVRKELGIPTIFNYLGPLANPAGVKKQLIGVANKEIAGKLIQVGKNLGYNHLLVVTGEDGVDEISISEKSYVYELKKGVITQKIVDPQTYGFKKSSVQDITGGSVKDNARIMTAILDGQKGPKRDIVVFNSAFAFSVAGKVANIPQGIQLAEKLISSGKAKKTLENLIKETQTYA